MTIIQYSMCYPIYMTHYNTLSHLQLRLILVHFLCELIVVFSFHHRETIPSRAHQASFQMCLKQAFENRFRIQFHSE